MGTAKGGLFSQGSHTSNSRSKLSKSSPGKYRASYHWGKLLTYMDLHTNRFLTSTIY